MLQAVGAAALAACAVLACADVFGVHNADLDASFDAAFDAGIDAPEDVQPDYVLGDVVDFDVNTAVCDGGITVVGADAAVWVSATGSDTSGCGTTDSPCQSVGYALGVAGTTTKYVYLDQATFRENVAIGAGQAGVTIQGGFQRDAGWTATCDNSLSTIWPLDDGGAVAVDIQGAPGVTLRLLTVRSKTNGAPGSGESVYAVRVENSNPVALENVTLVAQHGGDGKWGTGGAQGLGCTTGSSGGGGPGSPGAPSGPGTFGPNGFTPDTASQGGPGALGSSMPGSQGGGTNCITSCGP
ncbi:MAG TPA: hypothetical protein VGH28_05125 [Polyangiaceae bacterium]|jgi:hypothetical protein